MRSSGLIENDLGKILIDKKVIATYAGSVAVESFGIVGMAAFNLQDGIIRLLKKTHLSHGIEVSIDDDNGIYLDFHVIISYGVNISSVVDNLRESVRYKLEAFSGMKVRKIDIHVEGIRVID